MSRKFGTENDLSPQADTEVVFWGLFNSGSREVFPGIEKGSRIQ